MFSAYVHLDHSSSPSSQTENPSFAACFTFFTTSAVSKNVLYLTGREVSFAFANARSISAAGMKNNVPAVPPVSKGVLDVASRRVLEPKYSPGMVEISVPRRLVSPVAIMRRILDSPRSASWSSSLRRGKRMPPQGGSSLIASQPAPGKAPFLSGILKDWIDIPHLCE